MVFESLKKKYESARLERQKRLAAEANIRKKAKAQFYRTKELEEIKLAEKKARLEAEQKYQRLKKTGTDSPLLSSLKNAIPKIDIQPMGKSTGFEGSAFDMGGIGDFSQFFGGPGPQKNKPSKKKKRRKQMSKRKRRKK